MLSRLSLPTPPLSSQGPWNWQKPERQFLATEVSRDFIPPCPVRISPAQAAALGPAIPGGCGTLAANSIPGVEQGTCQIGRRAASAALSGAACCQSDALFGQVHGDTGGNDAFGCRSTPFENAKYASQYDAARPPRVAGCVRFAAFEAACTDSSR